MNKRHDAKQYTRSWMYSRVQLFQQFAAIPFNGAVDRSRWQLASHTRFYTHFCACLYGTTVVNVCECVVWVLCLKLFDLLCVFQLRLLFNFNVWSCSKYYKNKYDFFLYDFFYLNCLLSILNLRKHNKHHVFIPWRIGQKCLIHPHCSSYIVSPMSSSLLPLLLLLIL